MLVPALAAYSLRLRQIKAFKNGGIDKKTLSGLALLEGVCWGLAVVLKPFASVPAAACWLLSLVIGIKDGRPARSLLLDGFSVFAGGILVGALAVFWLEWSGNWTYFLKEVLGTWNSDYLQASPRLARRLVTWCQTLWPWSLLHFAAVPWSLLLIVRAFSSTTSFDSSDAHYSQSLFGVFYLAWFLQSNLLQHQFEYQLVPPVLLAISLLAGERNLRPPLIVGSVAWFAASYLGWIRHDEFWTGQLHLQWSQVFLLIAWLGGDWMIRRQAVLAALAWATIQFPLYSQTERQLWLDCVREGSTPEIRNRLQKESNVLPDWVSLANIEEYLRQQGVGDRELTCYSFSAVPLYVQLGIQPATRFVLLWSAIAYFQNHREQIGLELAESPQRFVVNDLRLLGQSKEEATIMWSDQSLPKPQELPPGIRGYFPWTEPIVFKSGPYLVHRVRELQLPGTRPQALRLW
jgi:hypothetical protein